MTVIDTSLEILEALDFQLSEPMCDFGRILRMDCCTNEPAYVIGGLPCPGCKDTPTGQALVCRACWDVTGSAHCVACGHHMTRDEAYFIVMAIG